MTTDTASEKKVMRAEAKRARGFMSLDYQGHEDFKANFFDKIPLNGVQSIAAYWPKGRELEPHSLVDEALERGLDVCLPVVEKDSKVLKFARYTPQTDMVEGEYKIAHPVVDDDTEWMSPDLVIVPMLAYDRKGYRLGYGGGYYDATLAVLKQEKDVLAVGIAFAQQACLFNLPKELHDVAMDWIVTEQGAQKFSES